MIKKILPISIFLFMGTVITTVDSFAVNKCDVMFLGGVELKIPEFLNGDKTDVLMKVNNIISKFNKENQTDLSNDQMYLLGELLTLEKFKISNAQMFLVDGTIIKVDPSLSISLKDGLIVIHGANRKYPEIAMNQIDKLIARQSITRNIWGENINSPTFKDKDQKNHTDSEQKISQTNSLPPIAEVFRRKFNVPGGMIANGRTYNFVFKNGEVKGGSIVKIFYVDTVPYAKISVPANSVQLYSLWDSRNWTMEDVPFDEFRSITPEY